MDEMTRIVYNRPMKIEEIYKPKGLYFAPMEGVTDSAYRMALHRAYPEWDYYCTDFLRIPRHGQYPAKKILEHFGERIFENPKIKNKTGFQVLTTAETYSESVISCINDFGFHHLDLNLGCPSKKVNSHKGGAYLLSDPDSLIKVVSSLRKLFNGLFSVKIRVGFRDDKRFEENIRLLESLGVDAIIIHGRTRDQLYKGRANWDYIKKAVSIAKIPIIGNGDVWTLDDIDEMFNYTGCHGIMLGRGALKTPWLATLYRQKASANESSLLQERCRQLEFYFDLLEQEYRKVELPDEQILKRFKAFSRYLFEDFDDPEMMRSRFLRSRSLGEFQDHLWAL